MGEDGMAPDVPETFVTVAMPVLNEADFIESCLASLLEQDYPPDRFEALVVDGRSTDDTRKKGGGLLGAASAGAPD